jgi:hypothetical protein
MEQEKKEESKEVKEEPKEKKRPGRKRKAVPTIQFEVKEVVLQFD